MIDPIIPALGTLRAGLSPGTGQRNSAVLPQVQELLHALTRFPDDRFVRIEGVVRGHDDVFTITHLENRPYGRVGIVQ